MTHLTNCVSTLGFRAILLLLLAASQVGMSTGFAADLDWPKVTHETKPWSRWWWMGSTATKSDLTAEMEKYAAAGIGGLEITPIYGVRGYEDRFTQYLTPEWMDVRPNARSCRLGGNP